MAADEKPVYPELLEQVAATVRATLIDLGIDEALARHSGSACAEELRLTFGGLQLYIPKGQEWELSVRDEQIAARHTGFNTVELAREYGLTERRVRQILGDVRATRRVVQQGLF